MSENTATPATPATIPVLTDAQKYLIRDKQMRFIVARANVNNVQNQLAQLNQQVQKTQTEFQIAIDQVMKELGIDEKAFQFDLESMTLVPVQVTKATPGA